MEGLLSTGQAAALAGLTDRQVRWACEQTGLEVRKTPKGHRRFTAAQAVAMRDFYHRPRPYGDLSETRSMLARAELEIAGLRNALAGSSREVARLRRDLDEALAREARRAV